MRRVRIVIIGGLIMTSLWSHGPARAGTITFANYRVCSVLVTTNTFVHSVQSVVVPYDFPEQCAGKGQKIYFNLSDPVAIYWKALLLTAKTLGRPVTYEKTPTGAVPTRITLY